MRLLSLSTYIFVITSSLTAGAQLTKKSSAANPDISLNALFTYTQSSKGNNPTNETQNGFALQEAELRLTSNIDANFRGDVILAVENEGGEFKVEPEEVFVDTLSLPSVTIRAGKFYAFWGRHNQLHTHSFPFIDAPLSRESILGEEGLNETGIAASYLLPTPWYFEVVAQALEGGNTSVFGSATQDDIAGVYFVKNLWELNDSSTLELDLGYGHGRNVNKEQNHIYNASVTYKWRPLEKSTARSFSWTTEYSLAEKLLDEAGAAQGRTAGFSSWVQYQMTNKWWIQGRTEFVDSIEQANVNNTKKNSALIGYIPSEYSALRMQYDHVDNPAETEVEKVFRLQLNVSMGAHPSHNY